MGAAAAAGACATLGAATVGAAATGVARAVGCALGVLPHATNSAGTAMLANRFDQLFTDLHLAVASWIELRQRIETLLHPFVVLSVLGSRSIHLM